MQLKFTSRLWLALAGLFAWSAAIAQQHNPLDIATEYVRTHHEELGLSLQDMDGMTVNDMYTDKETGISRVYFLQRHQGIGVYNAILNLSIAKDGQVFFTGNRFVPNLAYKVNTTAPVLDAATAVQSLTQHLGLPEASPRLLAQNEQGEFVFEKSTVATEDIKVRQRYQLSGNAVRLAWEVELFPVKSSDMWSARVDAVTGEVLDLTNWTVYCQVDSRSFVHVHDDACASNHEQIQKVKKMAPPAGAASGGTYHVWPWPVESPIHGNRQIVTEPHDPVASPFGWHDTNGQPGPEFTITRGNNVHAYEDSNDSNSSSGNEPDGGPDLIFDFPFDPMTEPAEYTDAAVVNLFYWNNIMHDMAYRYGFTEAAGNFQANNYGNGGAAGDFVRAEAQDGGGTNNANFATPPDGSSGRMQMFLWNTGSSDVFTVLEPIEVIGPYPSVEPAGGWGPGAYASATGVTAEVVVATDVLANPLFSDACDTLTNADQLQGRIALIDRGGCEFGWKARHVQNKGAVGVIICNFENTTLSMGGGVHGPQVNIPVIMLAANHCETIRQYAGAGLVASIKLPGGSAGPSQIDGDLDNGIIAHEYGHGISNRLTGGPSAAGCLSNQEQMGEGWSDFMSLITSVKPGDTATKVRGIGNYASSRPANGQGIRPYPYTTDMSINPFTYASLPNVSVPHGVGAVWCTMIWDLYWAMTEEYGWDEDIFEGTGGNNMAIRLVFEGMKTQPCSPGFVNGRDAILGADQALYGGVNKCLIWKVFARRGLGLSASQGSANTVGDETEAFDIPCECRDKVSIFKSVTPFINAGEEINVTLNVVNCKTETRTNVVVTDQLPQGVSFKVGSSNVPGTVSGNTVSFSLGDMPFEDTKTITYTLTTDPGKHSIQQFYDEVVDEIAAEAIWDYYIIGSLDNNLFLVQNGVFNSPNYAWRAANPAVQSTTAMELLEPWKVSGNRPVFRFYHRYDTQAGVDGGLLDIKRVGDPSWSQVPNKMLRNGYPGFVSYNTFVTPNLSAWSGTTNGEFIATYVDLSDWNNEEILLRFRFGTNDAVGAPLGWVLDDFEFMDMLSYNGEACVTSAQGDNNCAVAPEEGTIVESKEGPINSNSERLNDVSVAVFPNPASSLLNVALSSPMDKEVTLSLLTLDGREVSARKLNVHGSSNLRLDVSNLPAGLYFVKVGTQDGVIVKKVVIE